MGRPKQPEALKEASGHYRQHPSERPRRRGQFEREEPEFDRAAFLTDMLFDFADSRGNPADHEAELRGLWPEREAEVLSWYSKHFPGTRPWAWWRFSAPEPRRRLGGTGTAYGPAFGYYQTYVYGFPTVWFSRAETACRNNVQPIDPRDPPTFEGGPMYLRRLGLLAPGEAKRIARSDFKRAVPLPSDILESWKLHERILARP
jgi:hypothetical protein